MSYYIYILLCADDTYYTGCTNNLEKRIKQHNSLKSGAHYTKLRRPVQLIYKEKFSTLLAARRREHQIKTLKRKEKEKLLNININS